MDGNALNIVHILGKFFFLFSFSFLFVNFFFIFFNFFLNFFFNYSLKDTADLNQGVDGSTQLFICVKRGNNHNVPRVLMQLGTVQVGGAGVTSSKIPSEWTRVNNSCGSVSMVR